MSTVEAAGTVVRYSSAGSGPGLLLIHGSSIDAATNFTDLVPRFADRYTVVTPDYAGSGDTTAPDDELTLDLLVAQVSAATRDAVPGPVDVVGFSLGAVVAAVLAARRPELVRRLVLVAGWAATTDPRLRLGLSTWRRLLDVDADLFASYGLQAGIAGSRYAEVDSGHVVFAEQPDRIAALIGDFLDRPTENR